MLDRLERRVLGAVRLIDATTGRPLRRPLSVSAEGVRFLINRAQLYVISRAPGLDAHATAFEAPPEEPPPGSRAIEITIDDPLGEYLPRRATVPLPRSPAPQADEPDLFAPEAVAVLPSPNAALRQNWSGVRLSLRLTDGRPVRGALISLRSQADENRVVASGLSDERGEALVILPGLPVSRSAGGSEPEGPQPEADDEVTTPETPVTLEIVVDPDLPWPVDPSRLMANRAQWRRAVETGTVDLATGRVVHLNLQISLGDGP
ncbi:MAG TPA: hypothetical protein VFV80_05630 [Geminicoccaceae bacterium]|nr:hypothetical protein [Geminicoccaceae bacterium]